MPVMYMFCFLDKRESSPGSAGCQDSSPVPGRQADCPVPLAASPVRGRGGHPIHLLSHCSGKIMSYLGLGSTLELRLGCTPEVGSGVKERIYSS